MWLHGLIVLSEHLVITNVIFEKQLLQLLDIHPPYFQNSLLKSFNGIVSYSKVFEDIFEIPF
jgi:hypothetical protein